MSRPVTDDTATVPAAPAAPTADEIRDAVARTVGVAAEAIADDTNLVAVGLKSLHMMQLITAGGAPATASPSRTSPPTPPWAAGPGC